MWSPFFNLAFDFSMAFDEFKMPLTLFALSSLVYSYSRNSEINSITYDMLLRGLTTFESRIRLLSDMEVWLMLLEPPISPS